jgi:hypothetical protein
MAREAAMNQLQAGMDHQAGMLSSVAETHSSGTDEITVRCDLWCCHDHGIVNT